MLTGSHVVRFQSKVNVKTNSGGVALMKTPRQPPDGVRGKTFLEQTFRALDELEAINKQPHRRSVSPPPYPTTFPKNVCSASKRDFRSASGLFAIITGLERSGTTIVSALIMSAPNLYSGFECGLLEVATPSDFREVSPFFDWMTGPATASERLWALTNDQRENLVSHSCHAEQYIQLRNDSRLFHQGNNENSWIVDKTPRYIYNLTDIMSRTHGVPVIVTQKTREQQIASWQKRSDMLDFDHQATENLFARVDLILSKAQARYPGRIHVVNTTELMLHPDSVMESAFSFLGLQWKPEYKTLDAFTAKNGGEDKNVGKTFRPNTAKKDIKVKH